MTRETRWDRHLLLSLSPSPRDEPLSREATEAAHFVTRWGSARDTASCDGDDRGEC